MSKTLFTEFEKEANKLSGILAEEAISNFYCVPWNEGELFETYDNIKFIDDDGDKIISPKANLKNINKCVRFFNKETTMSIRDKMCVDILEKLKDL